MHRLTSNATAATTRVAASSPFRLIAGTPTVFDPLYPLPNFGAGGNMAFRTEALHAMEASTPGSAPGR